MQKKKQKKKEAVFQCKLIISGLFVYKRGELSDRLNRQEVSLSNDSLVVNRAFSSF